jgi:hypothetical protein
MSYRIGMKSMLPGSASHYGVAAPSGRRFSTRSVRATPSFSPGLMPPSMVTGARKLGMAPFPKGMRPRRKGARQLRRFAMLLGQGKSKGLIRYLHYDGSRKREVFRRDLRGRMSLGERRFNKALRKSMRRFKRSPLLFRTAKSMIQKYFGSPTPARMPSGYPGTGAAPVMGLETPTSYTYTSAPAGAGFGIGIL